MGLKSFSSERFRSRSILVKNNVQIAAHKLPRFSERAGECGNQSSARCSHFRTRVL